MTQVATLPAPDIYLNSTYHKCTLNIVGLRSPQEGEGARVSPRYSLHLDCFATEGVAKLGRSIFSAPLGFEDPVCPGNIDGKSYKFGYRRLEKSMARQIEFSLRGSVWLGEDEFYIQNRVLIPFLPLGDAAACDGKTTLTMKFSIAQAPPRSNGTQTALAIQLFGETKTGLYGTTPHNKSFLAFRKAQPRVTRVLARTTKVSRLQVG